VSFELNPRFLRDAKRGLVKSVYGLTRGDTESHSELGLTRGVTGRSDLTRLSSRVTSSVAAFIQRQGNGKNIAGNNKVIMTTVPCTIFIGWLDVGFTNPKVFHEWFVHPYSWALVKTSLPNLMSFRFTLNWV